MCVFAEDVELTRKQNNLYQFHMCFYSYSMFLDFYILF